MKQLIKGKQSVLINVSVLNIGITVKEKVPVLSSYDTNLKNMWLQTCVCYYFSVANSSIWYIQPSSTVCLGPFYHYRAIE